MTPISGDWGGKPYEDIMKGVDRVSGKYSFVDGDNVSAAGASYGGFMINWILGHTDRFRSLVSHDGVYELVSMYGSTEELWFPRVGVQGHALGTHRPCTKNITRLPTPRISKPPPWSSTGSTTTGCPTPRGCSCLPPCSVRVSSRSCYSTPTRTISCRSLKNARLWWNTVLGWLADHAGIKWSPPNL